MTSYVCQGLIEFLLSSHSIAVTLRENFVFKILPMLNPDGVFLGNNRCNLIGQDLNRCWNVATEFSHPTLCCVKNLLKSLDSSDVSRTAIAMKYIQNHLLLVLVLSNRFCFRFTRAQFIDWILHLWKYIRRCLSLRTPFGLSKVTCDKCQRFCTRKYDVQCGRSQKWFVKTVLL